MSDATYRARAMVISRRIAPRPRDPDAPRRLRLGEEALHDAFHAALEQWPRDGTPDHPFAWLVSAGRFKGIDTLRRRVRFDANLTEIADRLDPAHEPSADDRLRLVFTCRHPALPPDAQGRSRLSAAAIQRKR